MSSGLGQTRPSDRMKYTPLPLFQIAILLLLRFCEGAAMSVIFPFLNEVRVFTPNDNQLT